MCTDTPVPRCAFGEHPKEAANGLLLWYSSNKFGVNFIPRDNYMICEPCERICIVAQYVLMEVWIQRQVLIRLRPVEMIEIHGNRKPQQVQLTQAKSWVQTGYVPRVATSSVFSKHREIRLTEILPALFQWSLPLLILDKALFQALVEFQEALGTPLLNDHRIGYDVSWCFT